MLPQEETLKLIELAKAGDEEAKTVLVTENAPLIKSIVKRYRNKGVDYDDLMQLGSMGFLKAINNFDPAFQVKFSTYAVPMIMGEIKRFLRDDGYIKVSRQVKALYHKINQYLAECKMKGEEEPTPQQLAEHFGVDAQEVVFALDAGKMPVSLFEKADEDDDKSQNMIDRLVVSDDTENVIDKIALRAVLAELTPRERKIIMLRYFRDKTQSEIAGYLGVSQVQVSRLEAKIIEKLRDKML